MSANQRIIYTSGAPHAFSYTKLTNQASQTLKTQIHTLKSAEERNNTQFHS